MPLPIITINSVNADGTQSTFLGGLTDAMISAGFTLHDNFVDNSGNQNRVYKYVMSVATKGTAYIRVLFTSSGLVLQGFSDWDEILHSGSNLQNSNPTAINLTTAGYQFRAISHPEIRGAYIIINGVTTFFVGYLRPKNQPPAWWNENNFPFAFLPISQNSGNSAPHFCTTIYNGVVDDRVCGRLASISALVPGSMNRNAFSIVSPSSGSSSNSFDFGRRTVVRSPLLVQLAGGYIIEQFSSDFALVGSFQKEIFSLYSVSSSEVYTSIERNPSGYNYPALAIRTT